MRNHTETGASRVALVGVLAALSLIALYLSAVSPTARMGIVAIAGLFPAGAVVSAGLKAGFFCYGAAGLLGLLGCLLYTSPSPRDKRQSRMPSSA